MSGDSVKGGGGELTFPFACLLLAVEEEDAVGGLVVEEHGVLVREAWPLGHHPGWRELVAAVHKVGHHYGNARLTLLPSQTCR